MRSLMLLILLVAALFAHAASVVKCVDAAGKVTFVQHGCPSVDHASEVVTANSPRPSGDGPATRLADPGRAPLVRSQGQKYTVVGEPEKLPDTPIQAERPRAVAPSAPCVRWVERRINTSRVSKNGGRVGSSEIIKVPVPCR